jgi:hypothetical protein
LAAGLVRAERVLVIGVVSFLVSLLDEASVSLVGLIAKESLAERADEGIPRYPVALLAPEQV